MRVMNKRQEELFDELLKLAGGDPLLLEESLRTFSSTGRIPEKLRQVAAEVKRLQAETKRMKTEAEQLRHVEEQEAKKA